MNEIQTEHAAWMAREYPGITPEIPMVGMVEEAGELLHCVLKMEQHKIWGADGRYDPGKLQADTVDAIGDCVIYAIAFCNTLDWHFDNYWRAARDRVEHVKTMDLCMQLVASAASQRHPFYHTSLIAYLSYLVCIADALGININRAVQQTWDKVKQRTRKTVKPKVVCLCGSTRFYDAFQTANYLATMAGHIVLTVGSYNANPEQKIALDELHKRKIDMADEVQVLNVGGYIGESTRSEIEYATALGKPVVYLEAK